jgi:tetratricopeptide (TPR) repeat protein
MARPSAHRPRGLLAVLLGAAGLLSGSAVVHASAPAASSSNTDVAALIADLGHPDYATRERAAAELEAVGPAVVDALLSAVETSGDLEVALRAGWLVDALPAVPLAVSGDAPAAVGLLEQYAQAGPTARRRLAHRLLRLDDDAGIEPLARIVRLDRSPALSRLAAALLVREWRPGDPFWGGMIPRITRGLGDSQRLAARFARAVVAFSEAESPTVAAAAVADALAVVEQLEPMLDEGGIDADLPDDGLPFSLPATAGDAATQRVFRRCLVEMLAASGRREEALGQAALLLAAVGAADDRTAVELVWLCEHGLPEAVGIVEDRVSDPGPDAPSLAYAMALACRRAGRAERATELADHAFSRPTGAGDESMQRLQMAMLLAKWGAADWATREYDRVVADDDAPAAEATLGSIYYSEFLHDQGDDAGAAAVLRRVVGGEGERAADRILPRLQRDPESVESRLLYFEALVADEPARRRELLERSVAINDRDVDALIALYRLQPATPDERAAAADRVQNALRRIENEIDALPDDPNGYNEYAWLVSNTEGDLEKATRFSRQSLEKSFDTASYLDTLAHCHAAAGNLRRAVRTQSLALRMEPHSRMILQNLMRFHTLGGDAATPPPRP